jgi:glycosyltransferase involved in cell wall biosynthesis
MTRFALPRALSVTTKSVPRSKGHAPQYHHCIRDTACTHLHRRNSDKPLLLMTPNKTVLVVSFSNISRDSRVLRQISALAPFFKVATVGYGPSPSLSSYHLQLFSRNGLIPKLVAALFLILRLHQSFHVFWFKTHRIQSFAKDLEPDAILLNDVSSWPLAQTFSPASVVLDAHEYSPDELSDRLIWRLFLKPHKIWCSRFASAGSTRFCVEEHLCLLWKKFSGLEFAYLPNTSPFVETSKPASATVGKTRILHQGAAHPTRRIELMIEAINIAGPQFEGSFFLVGSDQGYMHKLAKMVDGGNSKILPPIPQERLVSNGSLYDIAILSCYPSNINNKHSLPNKFFQYIQSRLPIVAGPNPSIAKIVRQYDIGIVANDFSSEALADALRMMDRKRISRCRANLEIAARNLSWDRDKSILIDAVRACAEHSQSS